MYYYKFNIADWHLATSHLMLEEEAIYFKLINYYYDTEQPIPKETQTVIRRLRLGNYSDIVISVLQEFFVLEDDGWHHQRCDEEVEKYHNKAETNKKVGKLGGRPRKNNDLQSNPQETQTVSNDNPQETLTKNHKPITKNQKPNITTPDGVSDSVFNDYLEVRKTKKAKWSDTALKGLVKEAEKAGLSLQEAMELCCARGWVGFKAEWIKDQYPKKQETGTSALAELFMKARGHDVKQIT
jgi:uncharacterized protein YdaU (DUF1376 family)